MAAVLIVDDEKTPSVLASHVRAAGHPVHVARDGRAALDALGRVPFDVVLTDVRTAFQDGLALLRQVRFRWPDVVVLVTEYSTVRDPSDPSQREEFDHVLQPFTPREVGLLLDRVLEARTLTRH